VAQRYWQTKILTTVSGTGALTNFVVANVPATPSAPASLVNGVSQTLSGSVTFTAGTGALAVSSITVNATSTDGGAAGSATVSGSPTSPASFSIAGLTNGKLYTLTATATNAAGTSAASAASTPAKLVYNVNDKGTVTNVIATPTVGGLTLTWTAPVDALGVTNNPTSYTIAVSPATIAPQTAAGTATTFSLTGLTSGTLYSITITPNFTAPATGTAGTSSGVVQGDRLGYWTADGQTLAATTGPNLAGTVSYVDGPSGKAFNLSAGTLSTTQLATVSNAVSVMMWIKPSNNGTVMTLASRSTGPGMTGPLDDRHSFDLWLDPAGALVWETDDVGARVPEVLRASVPTVFDGQYHLVAATWDATAFNIYMDGALVATKKSQGGTLNPATSTPFSFGGPFPYTGAIDEPSVWPRVLTATEIASYYNTTPPRVTATVTVGTNPYGVAFGGTSIWVANYGSGTVSKINPTTNTVTATVTVGTNPSGVGFDGTNVWVTNNGSGTVSKINPTTNTVTATVTVGTGPSGVGFDGTSVWVANQSSGTVSKINPTTNTVTATVTVGTNPSGVAFDGTSIWVTNINSGTVSNINPATNTVTATVTIGTGTGPSAVAFDGTSIWVSNNVAGTVSKINPTANTVTATVTVGTGPNGVGFDGTSIWVTNINSGTVSKISV
jgi:hypothetical protein